MGQTVKNKFSRLFLMILSAATISEAQAMLKALHTAASGMSAQETNVNTISNNIANVNTTGFKRGRTEIDDLTYETVQEAGARSSASTNYNVGTQVGSGAVFLQSEKSLQRELLKSPITLLTL